MKGLEARVLQVMYSGTLKCHNACGIDEEPSRWLPTAGDTGDDGEAAIWHPGGGEVGRVFGNITSQSVRRRSYALGLVQGASISCRGAAEVVMPFETAIHGEGGGLRRKKRPRRLVSLASQAELRWFEGRRVVVG